jgi:mannosyltransferase OCH1-like enzyme
MPIPKVIYQTWKTKELHENILKIRNNIQLLNPGYEIKLYDDNDIDVFIYNNFNEYIYNCYSKLNVGASKADFWRYCVLYKNGGIYLDIDSEIIKPLDNLIEENDKCIITREANKGIFNNWIMIFEKEHPILLKTILNCCYNISNKITYNILYLTGPHGPYTNAINEVLIPCYNRDVHLYYENDEDLNNVFSNPKSLIRCRFFGIDMETFAIWKHIYTHDLYYNSIHWRHEQQIYKD